MNIRRAAARNPWIRELSYRGLRAQARIAPAGPPPRVLVNSFPKAGTHLVTAALDAFPDLRSAWTHIHPRPYTRSLTRGGVGVTVSPERDWDAVEGTLRRVKQGQYVTGHFPPEPVFLKILEDLGYRTIFVCRDPRDIVISTVMYARRLPRHPQHRRFNEAYRRDEDRMLATITGFPSDELGQGMEPLGARLRAFLPWTDAPNTFACHFEDLVGEPGGGSADAQLRILREIGEHIDRPLTQEMASRIAKRTWSSKSATFRGGVRGEWRVRFDERLRHEFCLEVSDELLAAYGYPGDC